MQYRAKDGDRLDSICHKHYGHVNGSVEAVLLANPGLAEQPPVLSAGIIIILPELQSASPSADNVISLWS